MSTTACRESFNIAVCISTLFGSPALDPIGTCAAAMRGAPCCFAIGGSAATIIVDIPTSSIAL